MAKEAQAAEGQGKEEKKKPKTRRSTALKRDLQSERRRLRNRAFRSSIRTAIRNFEETVAKGDLSQSKESLNQVYSIMDRGVQNGTLTLNKGSRTKARLAARLSKG